MLAPIKYKRKTFVIETDKIDDSTFHTAMVAGIECLLKTGQISLPSILPNKATSKRTTKHTKKVR